MEVVYKIRVNKKRFYLVIFSAIFGIVYILMLVYLANCSGNSSELKFDHYIKVTVHQGDTLWSIAERYCLKNCDIRDYISVIRKHNSLKSAIIYPGQVIEIPVNDYYLDVKAVR